MQGASGMLGDTLVFRIKDGKTIISTAPIQSDKPATEAQQKQRARFQEAVLYAKAVLVDESKKLVYEQEADKKKGVSAYNVAVADFLHAPDIQEVDVSNYTGQVGDSIIIKVKDDMQVEKVSLAVYKLDNSLLEEGEAELQVDGISWLYTATVANTATDGDRIVIKAYDLPGNVAEVEEGLEASDGETVVR